MDVFVKCIFIVHAGFTFFFMYVNSVLIRFWEKLEMIERAPLIITSPIIMLF